MLKKIVYFMDNYVTLGGAAHTLLRQAVLMKNAGKEICVVVSKYGIEKVCDDYLNICAKENIPVYELDYSVANQPERVDVFSVIENYENVAGFIKEQNPDIVHSVQLNPTVELACRKLDIPHVMNIYPVLSEFFELKYADVFPHYHICDSKFYADAWEKLLATKSYCVRTFAEQGRWTEEFPNQEKVRFICVGLFYELKNQLEVIKAFEQVLKSGLKGDLQLWGLAESAYAEECRQYIADNQLQEHVAIKGFTDNMEEVYQNSDVLICGSTRESYPNAVSEALANSVVVISTPVAGVPEIIHDKENGYLCKGYRASDIAESIFECWNDIRVGKIDRILVSANSTYERVHSAKAVKQSLTECYEKIMAGYSSTPISQYMIEDLKNEFESTIKLYVENQNFFTNCEYIKRYLWKIHIVIARLKGSMNKEKQCYIWGTGKYGQIYKEILDIFAPEITISGFIDTFKNGRYLEYDILKPEDALGNNRSLILVGVMQNNESIFRQLEANFFRYNVDYYTFTPKAW